MDCLTAQCWFRSENEAAQYSGAPQSVDVEAVKALVVRGRAVLVPVGPTFGDNCVGSLSVKEGTQGDTQKMPCGARSLFLNLETGAIVLRGLNKFFDSDDVPCEKWISDDALWRTCRVWVQRKMAGFVVTVFSRDGVSVELVSKHVAEGPHVTMAQRVLQEQLSADQLRNLAQALCERNASLCCECICRSQDWVHPVLEESGFDNQLVVFAIQPRDSLMELSMPIEEMAQKVTQWGLPVAPFVELRIAAELEALLRCTRRWNCTLQDLGLHHATDTAPLAEGVVILIEVPVGQRSDQSVPDGTTAPSSTTPWVRPLRLKAKTIQYNVLRSLRAVISGEAAASTMIESRGSAYHRAVLAWAAGAGIDVRAEVETHGVHALHDRFIQHIYAQPHRRVRDAAVTVGTAYEQLLAFTEKECDSHAQVPLTVVLLTGLPGSGKTTVASHIVAQLTTGGPQLYRFVAHVSRDVVTSDVVKREKVNAHTSKHKLRRLRSLVHKELLRQLNDIVRYSKAYDARGLVILDACHASVESRRESRKAFPAEIDGYHVVHIYCSDDETAVSRLTERTQHEVIHDTDEAQRALYNVKRKYVAPSRTEAMASCDTLTAAADTIAQKLVGQLAHHSSVMAAQAVTSPGACVLVTPQQLASTLSTDSANMVKQIVGDNALASLERQPFTPAPAMHIMAKVRLTDASQDAVVSLAAQILRKAMLGASCDEANGAWMSSVVQSVKSFIGWQPSPLAMPHAIQSVHLAEGHTKWLSNWLFGREKGRSVSDFAQAVRGRFDVKLAPPHVTLFYPTQKTRSARVAALRAWWQYSHSHWQKGDRVTVRLEELLIDRLALCFRVSMPGQRCNQWEQSDVASASFTDSRLTLHITVGVTSGTRPSYCGELSNLFTQWEQDNAALSQEKANRTAVRSRDKFHNFARFTFEPAITLTGVLEDDITWQN